MLTYFEGNDLQPVKSDFPDYDHLINHVSVQMDFNDCQLYKTPVVLTLQGSNFYMVKSCITIQYDIDSDSQCR